MKNLLAFASVPFAIALPAFSYTWPNAKIDELEDIMYQNSGYNSRGFKDPVTPCTSGLSPSRNTAAEWLRIAFHDVATYNKELGTGGMDASLMWENDFPPNIGSAFNSTFTTMEKYYTMRSGIADLFAVSAYTAVRACGGPSIPVRVGRVDTTGPGPDLGPVPVDTTDSLVTKFTRAGWTIPDMIKLTACGHTFGGVHGVDFPQIVGNNNNLNVHFDTTVGTFDNDIVHGYLNDNTTNALVKGPPVTNSDFRTFSADGNATMKALADPKAFQAACLDVFTRMLNLVPNGVVLTDVVTPIDVKPSNVQLTLNKDGSVQFTGTVRVHNKPGHSSNLPPWHIVLINYFDRNGASCSGCTAVAQHVGSGAGLDDTFEFYSFSAKLPKTGISKFHVVVDGVVNTNGGNGFPRQDSVIYQAPQSCLTKSGDAYALTVTAAVRTPVASTGVVSPVTLNIVHKTAQVANHSTVAPSLAYQSVNLQPKENNVAGSGYALYSLNYPLGADQVPTTFDIVSTTGNVRVADDFHKTDALPAACAPF